MINFERQYIGDHFMGFGLGYSLFALVLAIDLHRAHALRNVRDWTLFKSYDDLGTRKITIVFKLFTTYVG